MLIDTILRIRLPRPILQNVQSPGGHLEVLKLSIPNQPVKQPSKEANQAGNRSNTAILDEVEKAVIGKRRPLEIILAAILTEGHILIEDLPGLGKTLIASSLATALGLDFKRIQFTPDLLPADITGGYIYDRSNSAFRTPPGADLRQHHPGRRDQPRLAQDPVRPAGSHAGRSGDPGRRDRPLPEPFIVIATQNPIEYEGTFPLPEAQLDRFMVKVEIGYPTRAEEIEIIDRRHVRQEEEVEL